MRYYSSNFRKPFEIHIWPVPFSPNISPVSLHPSMYASLLHSHSCPFPVTVLNSINDINNKKFQNKIGIKKGQENPTLSGRKQFSNTL